MLTIAVFIVILGLVLLLPWMLMSPAARLSIFVAGTMLTAGSSAGVTTAELAFMALVVVLGVAALIGTNRQIASTEGSIRDALRKGRNGAILLLIAALIAFVWGFFDNGSFMDSARASVAYLTLPVGILCALDAGRHFARTQMSFIIFICAWATSIAFMLFYSAARGVASEQAIGAVPLLPSMSLAGVGVALGLSRLAESRKGSITSILGVTVPILAILSSGTRSGLALLAALLAGVLRTQDGIRPVFRLAGWAAVCALLITPIMDFLAGLVGTREFSRDRLQSLRGILTEGVTSDASGESRLIRYQVAWEAFLGDPILGRGFGAQYLVGDRYVYYLDTPLMYLATFGLVGIVLLSLGIVGVITALWRYTSHDSAFDAESRRLLWGSCAVFIALTPLSAILEERGFAVAMTLLVAFTLTPGRPSKRLPFGPPYGTARRSSP